MTNTLLDKSSACLECARFSSAHAYFSPVKICVCVCGFFSLLKGLTHSLVFPLTWKEMQNSYVSPLFPPNFCRCMGANARHRTGHVRCRCATSVSLNRCEFRTLARIRARVCVRAMRLSTNSNRAEECVCTFPDLGPHFTPPTHTQHPCRSPRGPAVGVIGYICLRTH